MRNAFSSPFSVFCLFLVCSNSLLFCSFIFLGGFLLPQFVFLVLPPNCDPLLPSPITPTERTNFHLPYFKKNKRTLIKNLKCKREPPPCLYITLLPPFPLQPITLLRRPPTPSATIPAPPPSNLHDRNRTDQNLSHDRLLP